MDPGTTTGVALLDLERNLVDLKSQKEFPKSSIRKFIISNGKPVVVAADVKPAPSLVEKLSATFNADLYYPEEDLSVEEKEELTQYFDIDIDSHARDALAAAIRAHRSIEGVLKSINSKSENMGVDRKELVENFFRKRGSVHQIARGLQEDKISKEENVKERVEKDWEELAKRYKEKLDRKEKEISRLREYKNSLEKKLEDLEEEKENLEDKQKKEILKSEEVDKWRSRAKNREKTIHKIENNLKRKEEDVELLKEALKKSYRGWKLVPITDSSSDISGADDSIIAVRDKKVQPSSDVKVVVVGDEETEEFYMDRGFRTVLGSDIDCLETENFYVVREKELEEKIEEKSDSFIDWLEDYRSRR